VHLHAGQLTADRSTRVGWLTWSRLPRNSRSTCHRQATNFRLSRDQRDSSARMAPRPWPTAPSTCCPKYSARWAAPRLLSCAEPGDLKYPPCKNHILTPTCQQLRGNENALKLSAIFKLTVSTASDSEMTGIKLGVLTPDYLLTGHLTQPICVMIHVNVLNT